MQWRAQKFEGGRGQFPASVSTENIGEDQIKKRVFKSFNDQFTPQNQVKTKKRSSCFLSSNLLPKIK